MIHIAFSICVFFACVIAARLLVKRAQNNHRRQRVRIRLSGRPERRRQACGAGGVAPTIKSLQLCVCLLCEVALWRCAYDLGMLLIELRILGDPTEFGEHR